MTCDMKGIIIYLAPDGHECVVDDGTGLALIDISVFLRKQPLARKFALAIGHCLMIIGPLKALSTKQKLHYNMRFLNLNRIIAYQIIDLEQKTERESAWNLEVIEFWNVICA